MAACCGSAERGEAWQRGRWCGETFDGYEWASGDTEGGKDSADMAEDGEGGERSRSRAFRFKETETIDFLSILLKILSRSFVIFPPCGNCETDEVTSMKGKGNELGRGRDGWAASKFERKEKPQNVKAWEGCATPPPSWLFWRTRVMGKSRFRRVFGRGGAPSPGGKEGRLAELEVFH